MARPRRQPKKKNQRRYHLADDDAHTFESHENPDWLVGAN